MSNGPGSENKALDVLMGRGTANTQRQHFESGITASASYGGTGRDASRFASDRPTFSQATTDPDTGLITLGPSDFNESQDLAAKKAIDQSWTRLVEQTFAASPSELDFPTNWWPGVEVENVYSQLQQYGPGPFGGALDPELHPERWAYPAEDVFAVDPQTGQRDSFFIRYDPSRAAQQFMAMDDPTRAEFNTLMAQAGWLDKAYEDLADYTLEGASAFAQVLQLANYYGISAKQVLQRGVALAERQRRGGGGGGGRGPTVKLEVPNYETLLVDAENAIAQSVGREVRDYELAVVADHMQERYGQWAEAKRRAVLGGNGTYEIPDPAKLSRKFVEDRYANEISRIQDVGETRQTNQLLINSATRGSRMMGGLGG